MHHQRRRHAEHGIGPDIIVVAEIQRRHQFPMSRGPNQHMNMRRPHPMPSLGVHQPADRPVHRDRVALWPHGPEMIAAILVGAEIAAHVHGRALAFLEVVQPVLAGLPYLDQGVRQRRAIVAGDLTVDDDLLGGSVLDDLGAQGKIGGAFAEEGAEEAALRAQFLGLLVVQRVDDGAEAQYVGQQNELLPDRRAGLADGGQELQPLDPFGGRQVHLAREGVHVAHCRVHDLLQPRVRGGGHLFERGVGGGEFVEIGHDGLPLTVDGLTGSHRPRTSRIMRSSRPKASNAANVRSRYSRQDPSAPRAVATCRATISRSRRPA